MINVSRVAALIVLTSGLFGVKQVTVDATVPGPGLRRAPTAGSFGTAAGTLPLRVTLEFKPTQQNEAGMTEVDFLLTNTGPDSIALPVSPNPRDLEPSNPKIDYTMTVMTLSVSPDSTFKRQLKGGATLYGNEAHPSTMFALHSGKSVRVMTQVAVPATVENKSPRLFAYVGVQRETIKSFSNQTTSDAQGIGYVISSASSY